MTPTEELRIELCSDVNELPAVRDTLRAYLARGEWDEFATADIVLAADEALTNVIRHGYKCKPGQEIRVHVREVADAQRGRGIEITIRDKAPQVPLTAIRGRDLDDIRPGGLGVHLIHKLMDEAVYSHAEGGGMQLLMRRYAGRRPGSPAANANTPPACSPDALPASKPVQSPPADQDAP